MEDFMCIRCISHLLESILIWLLAFRHLNRIKRGELSFKLLVKLLQIILELCGALVLARQIRRQVHVELTQFILLNRLRFVNVLLIVWKNLAEDICEVFGYSEGEELIDVLVRSHNHRPQIRALVAETLDRCFLFVKDFFEFLARQ